MDGRDEPAALRALPEALLRWYAESARQLPWRDEPTPYRVWISEVMLQQTRVGAVKPYFERFVAALPDVFSLADCPNDDLMKLWEGLGYYSRARNLKRTAKLLVDEYGGELPRDCGALKSLPGIGDYTAGAIASIAFGLPEPAVDGNVLRVLARYLESEEDVAKKSVKTAAEGKIREVLPVGQAGEFNQALMELGALVCLPGGAPLCASCPLFSTCKAGQKGSALLYPVKTPKKARRVEERTVYVVFDLSHNKVLLRRRCASGLLAGLWEFPNIENAALAQNRGAALPGLELEALRSEPLPRSRHIFTHLEWRMSGVALFAASIDPASLGGAYVLASGEELAGRYALPTAFQAYTKEARRLLENG